MSVSYKKLWKLLIDKDMKKKDLCEKAGISPASVTKMGRNGHVTTEILVKICAALDCRIEDMLQGGERMKYKLLKDLYDCFCTPPELQAQKQEIDECHQALSKVLGKLERRLVLQIIDAKDRIAEETSIDSFIAGFELAWKLSVELNHYENERSVSCQTAMGSGARFASKEEEK